MAASLGPKQVTQRYYQGVTVFGLRVAQEKCNKWNGC